MVDTDLSTLYQQTPAPNLTELNDLDVKLYSRRNNWSHKKCMSIQQHDIYMNMFNHCLVKGIEN